MVLENKISERMSEEKLTSNSLNIEEKSQSYLSTPDNRESYKPISEDIGLDNGN